MIRALLAKTGVGADAVSEVILGQVLTAGSGQNAAIGWYRDRFRQALELAINVR